MVLLYRYKYRRIGQLPSYLYSRPSAISTSNVSITSAVVDITILIIERTTVLVYIAIPNIASIMLSNYRDVNTIG
jgi:hypothetical protein